MADPRKVLGRAIRKRREELGLTQEALAEKADLHWTYVSGIERGIRNVTILKLSNIARALNLRIRDLVDDL
ncbi:MAG: helix-turn-helix transcriptional regulator [Acidobacteriaceae bacterium]